MCLRTTCFGRSTVSSTNADRRLYPWYPIRAQALRGSALEPSYRCCCRLDLTDATPDHSTYFKNRHGRFRESELLRHLFETTVARCIAEGMVSGQRMAVDASLIEADANRQYSAPKEEWNVERIDADTAPRAVREYLDTLDEAAFGAASEVQPKFTSFSDPASQWTAARKGPAFFSYSDNYLIDTDHGIIVDVEATPARLSQEIIATKAMLERSAERHDFHPDRLAADGSYGTGPFLAWLLKREVAPHIPVLDRKHQTKGKYDISHFQYDADRDSYTCLEGHEMPLRRIREDDRIKRYFAGKGTCGACPIRKACTDAPFRTVTRHMDEEARQTVRDLRHTWQYDESRRRRKKVEMLFAHLKRHLGLRRLRLRGIKGATEEFLLAATAQNLKRLAKMVPS